MPPPRVTTCTGRGYSVAVPLQAAQLVTINPLVQLFGKQRVAKVIRQLREK